MPTTPNYSLPYPLATEPADVPTDMRELADAADAMGVGFDTRLDSLEAAGVAGPFYSPTPPPSPSDGQEWVLPAGPGVLWRFRYNAGSGSAFKWEYVGGSLLSAKVDVTEATTSATYVDLATVGPQVTAPRAGEYVIETGCECSLGTGSIACATPKIGGAAALDVNRIVANNGSASVGLQATVFRRQGVTLAVNDVCKLQYKSPSGAANSFAYRILGIVPVRIS